MGFGKRKITNFNFNETFRKKTAKRTMLSVAGQPKTPSPKKIKKTRNINEKRKNSLSPNGRMGNRNLTRMGK